MTTDLDIVLDRAPKCLTFRPLPKVKKTLPYRSDIHYQEMVSEVRQCQQSLETMMKQLENVETEEEFIRCQTDVNESKEKIDKMIVMLKITNKIYSEMAYARERLHTAVRNGKTTEDIRKRIFWLEDRVEKLLGKEKSAQVLPKPAIAAPAPDPVIESQRSVSSDTKAEDDTTEVLDGQAISEQHEDQAEELLLPVTGDETGATFLTEYHEPSGDDKDDIAKELASLDSEQLPLDDDIAKDELHMTPDQPTVEEGKSQSEPGLSRDASSAHLAADSYWESEHHKFKFVENAGVLLDLDPSSYHNLAIAEPGTYVEEVTDRVSTLPWRPRRRESEFEEIHKDALNSLVKRVHGMYTDLHDAAMLSVDPHYKDEKAKGTFLDSIEVAKENDIMASEVLALPDVKVPRKAGFGRVYYPTPLLAPVKLPTAKLDRNKVFPPASERYSRSVLGEDKPALRIVNQGTLYEETRFTSSLFRKRRTGRGQPGGLGGVSSAEERRLREWVRSSETASGHSASGAAGPSIRVPNRSEESHSDPSLASAENTAPRKKGPGFKNRVQVVRGAQKFAMNPSSIDTDESSGVGGGAWKQMKPKSGALHHSGLKWERIKEIVHQNLSSDRPLERQDAARTLGLLRCADGMVLFALRKAMLTDSDVQTRYEATKALVLLGCWEENVLRSIIHFLKRGDPNVKIFLLQAMIKGKNVHFVDKALPSFGKLSACLSHLCESAETDVAFYSSVCLGKLCVADANARSCLLALLQQSKDHDRIIQACETLVRQLNCTDEAVVETVLNQLRWSPSYKNRSMAARLLVLLGPKIVCRREEDEDHVFALLETRLWDDPMKEVRLDIAKAIIALDMFPRACERAERKLENPDEDVRGQAVMAIGTLGIRNERIIRTLLEMLELDPSEYIRILVIRTFGAIGLADKRIIRSLHEKEKLETMFANEARKALKLLQNP